MLSCPKCGGKVAEDPCLPCHKKIRAYVCQNCGSKVPNPQYRG